jgi:hypothetical protein
MGQKNFLRVPNAIRAKVDSLPGHDLVVSAVRRIPHPEIEAGEWRHLELSVAGERVNAPSAVLPPASRGRYSRANVEGYEKVRRDLPKVPKTFSVDTPNWGDWSRGSHTMSWTRQAYQRDFFPPNETAITIDVLDDLEGATDVKFVIDRVLNRTTSTFEKDLLYALNLLQENVGRVDVFPSDATREDFLRTLGVTWEILPPGEGDPIGRVEERLNPSDDDRPILRERMEFLMSLQPRNFVTGVSGFHRYFGAQFGDDLVIFEIFGMETPFTQCATIGRS